MFSTLDWKTSKRHVMIVPEDREKMAFVCDSGTFQNMRIPFGLTNAPATFQRALESILSGFKTHSSVIYLKVVIVDSKSEEEHLHDMDRVLGLLRAASVKLMLLQKRRFFWLKVSYPTHEISLARVTDLQMHTRVLRGVMFPKIRIQVKSVIGIWNVL